MVASLEKLLARAGPILDRLPQDAVMVEVGVYAGALAQHLLTERPDVMIHCVDSWLGAARQPRAYVASGDTHAKLSQERQNELRVLAVGRLMPFGLRAKIWHGDSVAAADAFADESLDMAYLDGRHDYDGVKADIDAWWPKVKPGGWLGGDDYMQVDPRFSFGVELAVKEFVSTEIVNGLELAPGPMCQSWFVRKP
jgi:Methyltransferase domain